MSLEASTISPHGDDDWRLWKVLGHGRTGQLRNSVERIAGSKSLMQCSHVSLDLFVLI